MMTDSPTALRQIRPRLQQAVNAGTIAGAVSLVQVDGEIAQLEAVGWRDLARRSPMLEDTIFQIMSQSMPFIAAAVLMLQDEGRLSIDDLVERYLPEFGQPWLIEAQDEQSRRLRRPAARVTIAQLLSHMSGLPDQAPATRRFPVKMAHSLSEITGILSQQPLDAEPGARWQYSNQGIAVAARIVELVSGQEYTAFVAERIFAPLDMRDSSFRPAEPIRPRIASVYQLNEGHLVEMGPATPGSGDLKYRIGTRFSMPEAGIFSTAQDMARFHQLFLNGGSWHGRRLLSERAVAQMLTPRIAIPDPIGRGRSWQGLGWRLEPAGLPALPARLPAGAFHHSGALGSLGWGDPANKVVGILMVQRPGADDARDAMIDAVNAMTSR